MERLVACWWVVGSPWVCLGYGQATPDGFPCKTAMRDCAKTKLPPRQDLPHPTWSSQVVLHPNLVNPTHTLRLGRGLRASPRQPSSARRSLLLCCPSGSFQLRLGYQHEYYQIAITWKRSGTRWGTGGATPNFLTQGLYLR